MYRDWIKNMLVKISNIWSGGKYFTFRAKKTALGELFQRFALARFQKCSRCSGGAVSGLSCGAIVAALLLVSPQGLAVSFGIYESRAAGMGGVGVAAGNFENAVFYNPALLSFHDEHEDAGRDGRFFFPIATGQYYEEAIQTLEDVDDLGLTAQIDAAVEAYNADPLGGAAGISAVVADLETVLEQVGNRDYIADGFAGFYVSEPAKREGGSFFIGTRVVGGARAEVTAEDMAILDDYQTLMGIVGSGGVPGPEFDYLMDANGNLIDPSESVSSRYDIGAVAITEVGIALSKEYSVYGWDVAFGVTPKAKRVDVYREARVATDTELDFDENAKVDYTVNFDLGVAMELWDHYRVGLSLKDLIPESYSSALDSPNVEFKVRSRLGLAYVNDWVMVGLDVDLAENTSVAGELPTQEWAAGVEFNPIGTLDLRLGYKQDLASERTDVISGGIGWSVSVFAIEAAYMKSDEMEGGALQLGFTF